LAFYIIGEVLPWAI